MSIQDQPPPAKNALAAVWDLVIADMRERDAIGETRYRTRLQPFNGRHALTDAYQEALDFVVYLRQVIEEERQTRKHPPTVIDDCLDQLSGPADVLGDSPQSAVAAARAELAALREKAATADLWVEMAADLTRIADATPGGEVEHAIEEVKRRHHERKAKR